MTQQTLFDINQFERDANEFPESFADAILSFSGGKDSVASYVQMTKLYPDAKLHLVFCDTGDESQRTYDYIKYFNDNVHPVTRLATKIHGKNSQGRIMESVQVPIDLSLDDMRQEYHTVYDEIIDWYHRRPNHHDKTPYPTIAVRHCTRTLKVQAFNRYLTSLFDVASRQTATKVLGIRRAESVRRSKQQMFGYDTDMQIWEYYPIVDFSIDDVWQAHDDNGIERNTVYEIDERSNCIGCVFNKPTNVLQHILHDGEHVIEGWLRVERETGWKLWSDIGVSDLLDDKRHDTLQQIIETNPLFGCNSGFCEV